MNAPSQMPRLPRWAAVVGVVWTVAVVGAYYAYNWEYYAQKIAVFGRFLLR